MDWLKNHIWPSVQPIIQETGYPDYPCAIPGGTVFFVVYHGRAFAVSARHVLFPLDPICLFPTDISQKIIPLENVFYVPEHVTDDDFADFGIIEIDMRRINADPELGSLRAMDLEKVEGNWLSGASESKFVVLGYPNEHSRIEIEEESIIAARYMLKCAYHGISTFSDSVHTLKVVNHAGVSDFNGFSESPVFACIPNEINPKTFLFCGMALRGSIESGYLYFLESNVIFSGILAKPAPYRVTKK